MKIIVNFDRNWTNNDVEAIAKNPNLTAHELNMDVDTYLEALVVASLVKKNIVGLHKGILPFSCSILFVSCLKLLSGCSELFVSLSTL